MEINLDFITYLAQQVGIPASAFNPQFSAVQGDAVKTRSGTGGYGTPYYANDAVLGREYFLPVTLTYIDTDGTSTDWDIPFPVISAQARKTIIETPLTERRGTVKEIIQLDDYIIKIRGFIVNNTNDFPEAIVKQMVEVWEAGMTVNVRNAMTDIFLLRPDRSGSDACVIKSIEWPEIIGVKNVRHYVMELVSDEPFNLIDIT